MNVGFIGLGQMGVGMAGNLLKAGHRVSVFNRTPGKAQALVDRGAHLAGAVSEVCSGDAVVTMLADDVAVESVVFGEGCLLAALPPGSLHVSASTISVALADKLTEAHASAGQKFAAAPVFGRPERAAAGDLFIVAAGAEDALAAAAPLLDAMGQKTFVVDSRPSSANLFKLGGNFLLAAMIEALGETMALVGKAGLDRHQFIEVMTSTIFPAPVYKNYGGLIADRRFEPAGFAAPLGYKDVRFTLAAAEALKVPMPLASLCRDRLMAVIAQGGEKLDWTALAQLAERESGQAT